jgi:hypothetical protein
LQGTKSPHAFIEEVKPVPRSSGYKAGIPDAEVMHDPQFARCTKQPDELRIHIVCGAVSDEYDGRCLDAGERRQEAILSVVSIE